MFNIILACDNNYGIGLDNKLPWNFKKDMEYFKNITSSNIPYQKSIVIMGRNTMESLSKKHLPNRINIVISNKLNDADNKNVIVKNTFESALSYSYKISGHISENIWVIGGAQLYQEAFNHRHLNKIYYTFIDKKFECYTFISFPWNIEDFNFSKSTQYIL